MSDESVRELERCVASGDEGGRLALTRERLRKNTGVVAWWPGGQAPHSSAARVTLAYTSTDPADLRNTYTNRSAGWAVAVAGVEDLFQLARVARQAVFLDLASGDWLRTSARRAVQDVWGAIKTSEHPTTVDAFGRPRATVRTGPRAIDADRMHTPTFDNNARGIVREEPIYDTEWLPWRDFQAKCFRNLNAFNGTGAPRAKQWGLDTNCAGGYPVPSGCFHDATGISLELLNADMKPLEDDLLEDALSDITTRFSLAMNTFGLWPARSVALQARSENDQGYVIERPAPPALPFAFPFPIQSLVDFNVGIERPTPRDREGGFFVRATITGFFTKGMAA